MICPTPENISEIIEKLKELETTIEKIKDIPLDFTKCESTDNDPFSIEQLINISVGQSSDIFKNQSGQIFENLSIEKILALSSPEELILKRLSNLSVETLKKLLNNEIPQTWAKILTGEIPVTIRPLSTCAAGCGGGSAVQARENSPEGNRLQNIKYSVELELKKKVKEAEEKRWEQHIKPLIDEIEELLFPFWDYVKEHASYGCAQNGVLMEIIREGNLPSLQEVIREFERIKYKLEVESQQLSPEKPAKTQQKTVLSRGRRIIGWIVEGIIALALLVICSYFFGLVTGILVLAALLTIFYYLGWLEPTKAFIHKIPWIK